MNARLRGWGEDRGAFHWDGEARPLYLLVVRFCPPIVHGVIARSAPPTTPMALLFSAEARFFREVRVKSFRAMRGRALIGGDVQGVGYRAWMEREARAGGVSGWVWNRLNGDVEAPFSGPPDAVEALCAACWRGPAHARVENVEVAEADPAALGPIAGFRQIATR